MSDKIAIAEQMLIDSGLWRDFLLEKQRLEDLAAAIIKKGQQPAKNMIYVQQCETLKKLVSDIEYTFEQLKNGNVKAANYLKDYEKG